MLASTARPKSISNISSANRCVQVSVTVTSMYKTCVYLRGNSHVSPPWKWLCGWGWGQESFKQSSVPNNGAFVEILNTSHIAELQLLHNSVNQVFWLCLRYSITGKCSLRRRKLLSISNVSMEKKKTQQWKGNNGAGKPEKEPNCKAA